MSIRLVALDIDDTLVDHSSIIPQRSLDALRKAQAKGVEIVLATGRGYLGTETIRRQLGEGFHYIICFGGALVADYATGSPRIHRFLTEEDVASCIRIANDLDLHVQIYQGDEVIFQHMTDFAKEYCAYQKLPWRTDEKLLEHDLSRVPKVLIYAPPEQEEACKRIRELHMYDVLRADRCISGNSLEGRVPFGDLDFVQYVMSIDPALKVNTYGKGKYLLRKAFEGDYLPDEILWREKAAFSDAVGHSMVDDLKEYAETQYADKEFEAGCMKYEHARPFTKESLLYREIFEKYYPGQAEMITDFWMPNKAWEGCDVDDPSARVLSNYGDSGI